MTAPITTISSMATRGLLADLAADYRRQSGVALQVESVGGVDAARRVQAGEAFDLVVLASDAIDRLVDGGHLLAESRVDLVLSGVSVAVLAGAPKPDIGSVDALKAAVLAAASVGYSTGPSGVQLLKLFDRWGISAALAGRLVQAPAGVPVGQLVAQGQVALGFQQLSELIHLPGISLLGPLPAEVQINTIFSAAIGRACSRPDAARAVLAYLAGPDSAAAKARHGMAPA